MLAEGKRLACDVCPQPGIPGNAIGPALRPAAARLGPHLALLQGARERWRRRLPIGHYSATPERSCESQRPQDAWATVSFARCTGSGTVKGPHALQGALRYFSAALSPPGAVYLPPRPI